MGLAPAQNSASARSIAVQQCESTPVHSQKLLPEGVGKDSESVLAVCCPHLFLGGLKFLFAKSGHGRQLQGSEPWVKSKER